MKNKFWLLVLPILLLASVVRLYRLDSVPPSPYWEEVALGYDAYSISQTGKDHHGNSYPILAFPSYGDHKPSGYFYAIVPFVKVLGLNVLTVRLPSAIAGIISVGLLYLIGKEIFDEKIGIIASLLMSISPWAIQFSRGGWEVNFALMLILLGTYLLLRAKQQPGYLLGSVFFFALSMYTYHAARLFAPLIGGIGGMSLCVYYFRHNKKGLVWAVISCVCTVALVAPLALNLNNKAVSSRFTDTSIFSNPQPVLDSNAAISAHGGTRVAKIVFHRDWYYGAIVAKQWLSHFSPTFLFIRGDGNFRHGGWTGLLYPIEFLFILVSVGFLLVQLFRKFQNPKSKIQKELFFIFVWLALAAIAPALVTPAPHALRDLFAVPAYLLLSSYGIASVYRLVPERFKKVTAFGVVAVYMYFVATYSSQYLTVYPVKAQSDWQYGYRELYEELHTLKKPSEQVYVSRSFGRPSMYYLFFSTYDPATLQSIEPSLPKDQLELLQVGDYHFVDALPTSPGLYAFPTGTIVVGGKIVGNVVGLDGNTIWTLWRK